MNKGLQIRRRILNLYNKREDDFPNLRGYNDYLEEVEDIICNLVEGVDVQATEAKVAAYQEENADQIIASRARKAEEQAAALRERQAAQPGSGATGTSTSEQAQGIQIASGQYAPSTVGGMFMQPRPTGPVGQPLPLGMPSLNGEGTDSQRREERGAKAGGWTAELGRKRVLEEAFNSLWVN